MLTRKVRIYIFGLLAVIFGGILIFDYQGSEVCAQCVELPQPQLYKYRCGTRPGESKTNEDELDEAWCGPQNPNLGYDKCVPFVVYQTQNDGDPDEVKRHGCLIENHRLYFRLQTSGDDHENTAKNSICGAICTDLNVIGDLP